MNSLLGVTVEQYFLIHSFHSEMGSLRFWKIDTTFLLTELKGFEYFH